MNVAVLTTILRAIDNVTPVVDRMTKGFGASMGSIKQLLVGALSTAAVAAAVKHFQDLTGQLTDLGAKTGASASGMHALMLTFGQAGVSIETVASAINQMQQRLAGGDAGAVGALAQLGLKAADVIRMQPDKAFALVADKIGAIENPASKAKIAMEAFGRGGLALLPGLNGQVAETAAKFERMGLVLSDEVIKAGDDFGDVMGVMEAAGMALVANVLTPLLPALVWLAESLASLAGNAIPAAQHAFDALVLAGMKSLQWIYEFIAGVADAGAKVPMLGQALGLTSATADSFRERARGMADAVAAFSFEAPKAAEGAKQMAPPIQLSGDAMKHAAEQAAFLERTLRQVRWDDLAQRQRDLQSAFDATAAELQATVAEAGSAASEIHFGIIPDTSNWQKSLEALKPALKDAQVGAASLGSQLKGDLKGALQSMPQTLTKAFQGGGGMTGGMQAVGSQLGGQLGEKLGGALANKVGGALGGAIGMLGGPVGSILGSMAGKAVGGLVSKIFGGNKEAKQVNDMRDQFVSAAGGVNELNKQAQAAGMTLDKLLKAKNVKDYEAAVRELQGAFADQAADQELLQSAVEKYGLTLADLGPKFAQGQLDKQANQVLNEWRVLTAAGADMNAVAAKMAPSMSDFVNEAIRSGGQVPREMQPIVRKMIEMGTLVNEAGEKFTDMGEVPWKDDVTGALTTVADKLDKLVDKIAQGLTGAFGRAAEAGEAMANRVAGAMSIIPTDGSFDFRIDGGPGFATGTMGQTGSWFADFKRGRGATLHGVEAVVTPAQAPAFARDVLGGAAAGQTMVHNDFRGALVPDYAGAIRMAEMMSRAASVQATGSRRRTSVTAR